MKLQGENRIVMASKKKDRLRICLDLDGVCS
ncbi:hypothetical protein LCGC14_1246070, partial [marine sediment metagenome]